MRYLETTILSSFIAFVAAFMCEPTLAADRMPTVVELFTSQGWIVPHRVV